MTTAAKPLPTVLITGCSAGGIGSALAEAFHARGLHVFATARSLTKMEHLQNPSNMTLLELDVTSESSISAAVGAVTAHTGGKLDYLVNNSGRSIIYPALDTKLEDAKALFDVNFWGMVAVIQAFAPLVIEAKGTIVNNASLAAVMHVPWGAFYNSSKAALKMYGETLRLEMAPLGVKVLTLMTGTVDTNIAENCPHDPLPEGSRYWAASAQISAVAGGSYNKGSMPIAVYAKKVVNDILNGASGTTWRGKMASLGWFVTAWFPTWMKDRALVSGSGLDRV